jgi:hypothetical protein
MLVLWIVAMFANMRHVVRAVRDHHHLADARFPAVELACVLADLGRSVHAGGQLRIVLHAVPALLPVPADGGDGGSEDGDAAGACPRPAWPWMRSAPIIVPTSITNPITTPRGFRIGEVIYVTELKDRFTIRSRTIGSEAGPEPRLTGVLGGVRRCGQRGDRREKRCAPPDTRSGTCTARSPFTASTR